MDTDQPASPRLRFELRLALTLQPQGLQPVWRAELLGTGSNDSLHFESMPELIRYLDRLNRHGPPARGIR